MPRDGGSYEIRVGHEALKAAVPTKVVVKDGETVTLNVTMKLADR